MVGTRACQMLMLVSWIFVPQMVSRIGGCPECHLLDIFQVPLAYGTSLEKQASNQTASKVKLDSSCNG